MDLNLLQTLKQRLINAKEFSKVWEYFLDHFGENPQFLALGDRTRHGFIESLLIETAKKSCGLDIMADEILLTALPEQRFLHGGYCRDGQMINVLFFEDAGIGSIYICSVNGGNSITARFMAKKLPTPGSPSLN